MRLAICMSGQMRCYKDCRRSLIRHILDKNNCDLFISTWDGIGWDYSIDPSDPEHYVYSTESYNLIKSEDLLEAYHPYIRMVKVDNLEAFNEQYVNKKPLTRIERNMYGMYYKIKDCFELMKQYEEAISKQKGEPFQYDYIIRVRPDLCILRDFTLRPCHWDHRDTHYAMSYGYQYNGMNDQFGLAKRSIMEKAFSLWDRLEEYMSRGYNVNGWAEILLKTHFEEMGIPHQTEGYPSNSIFFFMARMHHPLEPDARW